MNDYTQCPACGSSNSRVSLREFKAWGWQPLGNRICGACGTAWRPQCPRWAAVASILVGSLMWAVALAFILPEFHKLGFSGFIDAAIQERSRDSDKAILLLTALILVALWPFLYGVAVLRGRAGELKILGRVCSVPDVQETRKPEDTATTNNMCVGCRRSIPPGSVFCPHCGLRLSS